MRVLYAELRRRYADARRSHDTRELICLSGYDTAYATMRNATRYARLSALRVERLVARKEKMPRHSSSEEIRAICCANHSRYAARRRDMAFTHACL